MTTEIVSQQSVELIKAEMEKLTLVTKEKLKGVQRVAIDEAWKILQLTTASIIQIIESIGKDLAGSEKKDLAMNMLNQFYDKVFMVVDVPIVPNILEPIIHKYVKTLLMLLVNASIDVLVTVFRNTGVFLQKKVTG